MSAEILYIHGFASSYNSLKARQLEDYFAQLGYYNVIHPQIPVAPFKAINFLEQVYEHNPLLMIIGSSLGGFYALYMHMKYDKHTFLINPSLKPHETRKEYIGIVKRQNTDDFFNWTQEHIDQLEVLYNKLDYSKLDQAKLHFFISEDDELLDFSDLERKFPYAEIQYFKDSGHAFRAFEKVLPYLVSTYVNLHDI